MSPVADAVEVTFLRAASALIPAGSHVLVAVSGGGDSVALLHLLLRLAPRRRLALTVAHLDHALRRGSSSDRKFVAALSAKLRLACVVERRRVRAERRKDESLEEAARRIRRAFLIATAKDVGAPMVATGHTLDDQAETILMRFARGAGPAALAGMAPAGPGPFVRPMLGLEREALRRWLRQRRLRFLEDPTNASLAFDRNRVRRLVMPVLAEAVNPRAARHLVEAADRLRRDAEFLDAVAGARLADVGRTRGGAPAIDAAGLVSLPGPVASRVARLALEQAGCDPRRISSRHVEALRRLGAAPDGASLNLPGRKQVTKRDGLLEFA